MTSDGFEVVGVHPDDHLGLVLDVAQAIVNRLENDALVDLGRASDDASGEVDGQIEHGSVVVFDRILPLNGKGGHEIAKPLDFVGALCESLLRAFVRSVLKARVVGVFLFLLESRLELFQTRLNLLFDVHRRRGLCPRFGFFQLTFGDLLETD